MPMKAWEREYVRDLAKRQAEIASAPGMAETLGKWRDVNDGKPAHPMVVMEYHGAEGDVYPALRCEDGLARHLEGRIGRLIYKYETFRDDRFVPATFSVGVQTWFTPFGYKPEYEHADASDGSRSMGYMFRHAVDDMERDFGVFRPSTRHVDADLSSTRRHAADVADVIGDVLPVVTDFPSITFGPSHALIQMMSMETLFTSMVDHPELFHRMMRALTDDFLSYLDALDASGVVTPGGDTGHVSQDTCGYCTELPGAAGPGGPRGVAGIWGYSLAQESVGLSPAMFDEFLFSYTKEVTDRFGLVSFGCCEPLDAFWEGSLSRMGNLRKLSVSPWCAEERMGEMLRGRKVVYHRKPFPVLMTTPTFDEGAFRAHMERTVRAARGCPLEVTFRDITSCAGDPARLVRAVEITREAFADCYR